jgi:flagellar hook-length control protein FliK
MATSFFTRMMQQGRMDRAQGGQKHAQTQGFGAGDAQVNDKDQGFKAAYLQVARSNEQAVKVTDSTTSVPTSADTASEGQAGEALLQELLRQQMAPSPELSLQSEDPPECQTLGPDVAPSDLIDIMQLLGLTVQPTEPADALIVPQAQGATQEVTPGNISLVPVDGKGTATSDASAIISQALLEISEALHLKIDPGLKNLSFTGSAAEGLSEQFSDILSTLKQIAGVLNDAAVNNQKMAPGSNPTIGVQQAREMALFIQVRVFRIEIGVSMLGMADKVQADLAQKPAKPFTNGIPQALDPKTITMPQSQIEKMLGTFFQESSSNIAALVQKMRELCVKYGQGNNAEAGLKVVLPGTSVTQTVQIAGAPAHSPFDSQVLRKLLKIEGKELLAVQNAEAATQAVKLHLTTANLKNALQSVDLGALKSVEDILPVGDASGKNSVSQLIGGFETKSALLSYRTSDETVMSQITEKLQSVIRSGLTEIRLQLRPESLGEVKLRIRVEGDVVFARINVESQQIKQIVETNLQSLKDSLNQQHLSCGSLEVSVGNDGWNDNDGEVHERSNGKSTMASGQGDGATDDVTASADVAPGSETGRRFGENTVEYFA